MVSITSFAAAPAAVPFLGESTLSWTTADATSCTLTPDGGSVDPNGSTTVASGWPATQASYTLACAGPGGPVSDTVTVDTTEVVHTGDFTINTGDTADALAGVNVITGSLTIDGPGPSFDAAPLVGLTRVDGDLIVKSTQLPSLSFPWLQSVGGSLVLDTNTVATTLDFPELGSVGDRLYISRNWQLPRSEIDALLTQLGPTGVGGAVLTYENSIATSLASLNQSFLCELSSSPDEFVLLDLYGGAAALGEYDSQSGQWVQTYSGTFSVNNDVLTLSIPPFPDENANVYEVEYDLLVAFQSPSFSLCHAVGYQTSDAFAAQHAYQCPDIGYLPGTGYDKNKFWLTASGSAEWLHTTVTFNPSDELYSTRYGIYVLDGDRVHFAFANYFERQRFLSAQIAGDESWILVDELEPEAGTCDRVFE